MSAEAQKPVAPRGERRRDLTRDGEDLPPLFQSEIGCDQRAASFARLDDDDCGDKARDDAVPGGEAPGRRLDARWVLGNDQPSFADLPRELRVRGRVVTVYPAAEHGDRDAAGLERAAVRLPVNSTGHATHDHDPRGREIASERPGYVRAIGRAGPGSHHRDRARG